MLDATASRDPGATAARNDRGRCLHRLAQAPQGRPHPAKSAGNDRLPEAVVGTGVNGVEGSSDTPDQVAELLIVAGRFGVTFGADPDRTVTQALRVRLADQDRRG